MWGEPESVVLYFLLEKSLIFCFYFTQSPYNSFWPGAASDEPTLLWLYGMVSEHMECLQLISPFTDADFSQVFFFYCMLWGFRRPLGICVFTAQRSRGETKWGRAELPSHKHKLALHVGTAPSTNADDVQKNSTRGKKWSTTCGVVISQRIVSIFTGKIWSYCHSV